MTRPIESNYTSHVAYTRALEEYSLKQGDALRMALEALERIRHWAEADKVNYTGDHPVAQVRAAIAKIKEVLHD